jgi:hypothetical protein
MEFILSIPLLPTPTATVSPCLKLREKRDESEAVTETGISFTGEWVSVCLTNAEQGYFTGFDGAIGFIDQLKTIRMENRHKPLEKTA